LTEEIHTTIDTRWKGSLTAVPQGHHQAFKFHHIISTPVSRYFR